MHLFREARGCKFTGKVDITSFQNPIVFKPSGKHIEPNGVRFFPDANPFWFSVELHSLLDFECTQASTFVYGRYYDSMVQRVFGRTSRNPGNTMDERQTVGESWSGFYLPSVKNNSQLSPSGIPCRKGLFTKHEMERAQAAIAVYQKVCSRSISQCWYLF